MGKRFQITARDRELIGWLHNPLTVPIIQKDLGLFPSYKTLYRRLGHLRAANLIQITGYISGANGRPVDVYAVDKFKQDNLETHEVPLSRIILKWRVPCLRGKRVHPKLLPDATIHDAIHVEYDTGSVDVERVKIRLRKYLNCEDAVIFLTTPKRKQKVMQVCAFLTGRLLVATHDEAMQEEAVLTHCDGDTISLKDLLTMVLTEARHKSA